jgi:hypothetical protein
MSRELDDVKRATAVLFACLLESNKDDPEAKTRFVTLLEEGYAKFSNKGGGTDGLELLNWTRQLLTGFSWSSGHGRPFFPSN